MVSVVIPSCNRSRQLRKCLDALTKQTHPDYEVIVVDDGSSDDTPLMVARMTAEHPAIRFRYLRNERNIGANPSRNRGITSSTAKYIAFLDSDCVPEPNWLEMIVRGFADDRVAAVTGLVNDQPPANIYERTSRGSHRLHQPGAAHRLVGCNMCVRRDVLERTKLDEDRTDASAPQDFTVSGRGDEEGLFLMIRAAGLLAMTAPDAVVLHEHHYTRRSFFRQAYRGGQAAARLVYKYYLPQRLDMAPFILGYLTLPLPAWSARFAVVPLIFFAAAIAALAYNEMFRKGKTILETILIFPMQLAYYHVRLFGYVRESLRLRLTDNGVVRVRLSRTRSNGRG